MLMINGLTGRLQLKPGLTAGCKDPISASVRSPISSMNTFKSKIVAAILSVISFVIPATSGLTAGQGVQSANGPFSYSPSQLGEVTYLGDAGSPVWFHFDVTAPSGGTVFPAGGSSADVSIRVFGIEKICDANGVDLLEPVDVDLESELGAAINDAIIVDPDNATFVPGWTETICVYLGNPAILPADYGCYSITIKAQSPGAGIGVGSGTRVLLKLFAATETDTTPPDVTILAPSGSNILGQLPLSFTAKDPAPGTGVESVSASISSVGGAVSDVPVALSTDLSLPQAADVLVTATGTFVPKGGLSGSVNGTTIASAFASASLSGNGSYTLTARAVDGAGNEGSTSQAFDVTYNIVMDLTPQINSGQPTKSNVKVKFTANRSAVTSDGAFMYDKTVVVRLVYASDNSLAAERAYGTGDIKDYVQINGDPAYETHIYRPASVTTVKAYKVQVFFKDVDGNLMKMAESGSVNF